MGGKKTKEMRRSIYQARKEAGVCTDCGKPRDKSGLACSSCRKKATYKNKRRRATLEGKRNLLKYRLDQRYNLKLDEYEMMLERQNGVCIICGKVNKSGLRLCVDHDHTTGMLRDLLCTHCNVIIGRLENGYFNKYFEYIEKWSKK